VKVLDSFTDGFGLRSVDARCGQSQMRYGDFRAMVYSRFQDLKEHSAQTWDAFIHRMRGVQPQGWGHYNYTELNKFDNSIS
jgi:hypothetical protein